MSPVNAANQPDVPQGFKDWWSTTVEPWWRDFDYLGHVTAASYAAIYEQAFAEFVAERWHTSEPSYVVARLDITYLREIRPRNTPLRIHVSIGHTGRTSLTAAMVLCDVEGLPRSIARARYCAWDREQRTTRPLTTEERTGLATS
ncbi:acyl-CoA thioesterase [Streptomyces sp. NPDC005811]|uniref:acyl-CoA thioesterase n=1 Tax=Streptomyces sp. NPDC005811 TaxID=3154565 RepID=UPI00340BAB05